MATTYSAVNQTPSGGLPNRLPHKPAVQISRSPTWFWNYWDLTAAIVINDVFEMVMVPKGATVFDATMAYPALDSSTGVTVDLGYGTDPDYWVAASTVGRSAAGGIVRAVAATAVPLDFTAADTVDILIHAAASGTATSTGRIWAGALMGLTYAQSKGGGI